MPGGNRRGPQGDGPRSGRGAGFCTGNRSAGFFNRDGTGRGRGREAGGRGRGLGSNQGYDSGYDPGDNRSRDTSENEGFLSSRIRRLEEAISDIRSRLGSKSDG